jgi:serine/threonine-protein kinase ATR
VSYVKDVLTNYGMSVKHGHHHIYQALPRLLTVWFEFGTHCVGLTKQTKEASHPIQSSSTPYVG